MASQLIYYHRKPGAVWFATNLAGLLRFPSVPRELDPLQLSLFLINQAVDAEATIYRQISVLPPGTLLTIDATATRRTVLWRPDPTRRLRLRRNDDYVQAARELLDRSVKRRLRPHEAPAAMLTAGLDSSAVAVTAARLIGPAPLQTYTVVPAADAPMQPARGWYESERDGVSEIAAAHQNLHVNFCTADDKPASLEWNPTPLLYAGHRPYLIANHLGWFEPMYRRAAADGHTALLCGDLGNLTLTFDGLRGLGDLLRRGRLDLLIRSLAAISGNGGETAWATLKGHVLVPLLSPRLRDSWLSRRHGRPAWSGIGPLRPETAAKLEIDEQLWQAGFDGGFGHQSDHRVLIASFLSHRRIRWVENLATIRLHYGVEHRDPMSDPDLVDFCLAIPSEQYLLDGRPRSFARRVLADRLPPSVTDNLLRGRQNPQWYSRLTAQRDAFDADLKRFAKVPLAAELLDLPRLGTLLDNWPADAVSAEPQRASYEFLFTRAIQMGRFVCWAEAGNA